MVFLRLSVIFSGLEKVRDVSLFFVVIISVFVNLMRRLSIVFGLGFFLRSGMESRMSIKGYV